MPPRSQDAGSLAGLIEKHARLDAAEEAYIAIASDLDRRPAHDPRLEARAAG